MAEFIAGGFDFSPLIQDGGFTVTDTNIYDNVPGTAEKFLAGVKTQIEVTLKNIKETVVADIKETLSENTDQSGTVLLEYVFCGEEKSARFSRPEITLTAVTERADGLYVNLLLRFVSEGFYSGDCL